MTQGKGSGTTVDAELIVTQMPLRVEAFLDIREVCAERGKEKTSVVLFQAMEQLSDSLRSELQEDGVGETYHVVPLKVAAQRAVEPPPKGETSGLPRKGTPEVYVAVCPHESAP